MIQPRSETRLRVSARPGRHMEMCGSTGGRFRFPGPASNPSQAGAEPPPRIHDRSRFDPSVASSLRPSDEPEERKERDMTTNALLREVRHRWATRPRINTESPSLVPTRLLVPFGGLTMLMTAHLVWGLSRTVPAYFEDASQAEGLDFIGVALGLAIAPIAAFGWVFGSIARACLRELGRRLLGPWAGN